MENVEYFCTYSHTPPRELAGKCRVNKAPKAKIIYYTSRTQ